jgi:hypothetical protein
MKPTTRRFLRSLLVRPGRDNTARLGFLFYLVLVGFILVLGHVFMRPKGYQTTIPNGATGRKPRPAKVDIRRAASAGANFTQVPPLISPDDNPLAKSERAEKRQFEPVVASDLPAAGTFLDTVRLAMASNDMAHVDTAPQMTGPAGAGQAPAALNERGAAISAGDAASADDASERGAGQPVSVSQPLQVEAGSLDVGALTIYKRSEESARPAKRPSGFETGNFLPKGQLIPVIFQTNVTTLDLSGMVEMQVAGTVKFNGDVIRLPYGTKIYGSASTKNVADRIGITANTIVLTDGTEFRIEGVALDVDARAGVRGYYVPQPAAVELFPYANAGILGALQTLGQSQQVTTQSALGLTTSTTQNPNSWRNSLVTAGQQALQDAFNREQTLLDQRYPAYVIVKRGTMAYIQLSSALDLDAWKIFQSPEEQKPAAGASPDLPVQLPSTVQELLRKLQSTVPSG